MEEYLILLFLDVPKKEHIHTYTSVLICIYTHVEHVMHIGKHTTLILRVLKDLLDPKVALATKEAFQYAPMHPCTCAWEM